MKVMRVVRASAIAACLVVLAFGIAWAHARLVRSEPAANAHVGQPPKELRLEFSEAVAARTSRVELVAPDSQRTQLALRGGGDSASSNVLLADVPPLTVAGAYRVEWRLVGPDGHAVTGRYVFTVDTIPPRPLPPPDTTAAMPPMAGQEEMHEPADSLLQQGIRFLSFLSMLVIIGAVAFRLFVLPAASQSASGAFSVAVEERLRFLANAGAWLLLALAAVRLTSHATLLSGSLGALRARDFTDLLAGSTFGRGWLLQVAVAIVLLVRLRAKPAVQWSTLAWVTVALAISAPFLGHPSAIPDVPAVAMSLDAIHVLAAGGWAGAILMLSVAAAPMIGSVATTDRIPLVRNLLRAFSPLALTCAAILAVTGAISGWLQLRELGLIFGSEYGLMLFRKVVVVLLVAAVGAYHWRVVQPSIDSDRSVAKLRTSLAIDVVLVLLILVVTAVLTGTAPPVR